MGERESCPLTRSFDNEQGLLRSLTTTTTTPMMMMNNVVAAPCAKRSNCILADQEGHHHHHHHHHHRGMRRQFLAQHRLLHILVWLGAVLTIMMTLWWRPRQSPAVEKKRPTTTGGEFLAMVGDETDEDDDDDTIIVDDDDVDVIEIDYNSTLGNDVAEIIHHRRNSTVVVTMQPNASCRHPVLRGRLSGPALTILEWERHTLHHRTTRLLGRYNHHLLLLPTTTTTPPVTPTTGMLLYYIEIIALLCEEWDYDTDFQPICLENPQRHRVTAWNASITVRPPPPPPPAAGPTNDVVVVADDDDDDANATVIGRWLRKMTKRPNDNNNESSIIEPLYTRWQSKTCGPLGTSYCPEATDSLDRFRPYEFIWQQQQQKEEEEDGSSLSLEDQIRKVWWDNNNNTNDDTGPNATTTTTTSTSTSTKLCYVGDSHAEQLFKSTKLLLFSSSPGGKKTINQNVTNSVAHYYAQYPHHVNRMMVQTMWKDRCQHVVIGLGQWPASYKESRPYLFREYEETMTKMWVDILNYKSSSEQMMMDDNDDGPPPTFYLRSMNYNPLGGSIASCPPTDWRSPVVVDGYNTILRRLAEHFNIPFIDNIFIVGPMWDSAKDWSHYNNEVGHRMAAYIVARVLHLV